MDFTFLKEEEIFESDILKPFGKNAAITDFAILLGGYVSDSFFINNSKETLADRAGYYWTKSNNKYNNVRVVDSNGDSDSFDTNNRDVGCRPAFSYSSISDIPANGVSRRLDSNFLKIEYGYYPQQAVNKNLQNQLENLYKQKILNTTGNYYTTDSKRYDEYDQGFEKKQHFEYEYNVKKYVRVRANSYFDSFKLSNGIEYKNGDYIWIEVQPIEWLVNEKFMKVISQKILFSGVQFNHENNYKGDFNKTDIKKFMDDNFSKDIEKFINNNAIKVVDTKTSREVLKKTRISSLNPDKTLFTERRKLTDTELIHDWIESGQSVLLRGPSGIGKTERIKTLYPNLVYIKLTNNMFPEKIVGSINLQTGQSIPPDFAKQVIMNCATEDEKKLIEQNIQNLYIIAEEIYKRSKNSDEKVVILLDELLNVKPAVQSLVYTLVLNRIIEIGNGLKLPKNVVIVATGNQKKYSSVAQDLAEPLEKRFDHIFDMEPKVGEWINEYAIPNKIHPSIISYIFSKYIENNQSEYISDINYFYEEPEVGEENLDCFGCKGRTNDPRGWVSISKTLYDFEKNLKNGEYIGKDVENLLKISLATKLREEWAIEFFNFYNIPTLTPEEVMNNSYTQADLPRDTNERFAYLSSLLLASKEQVASCRQFIKQYCDPEYLAVYDLCWMGNDLSKVQIIYELQELDKSNNEDKKVGMKR